MLLLCWLKVKVTLKGRIDLSALSKICRSSFKTLYCILTKVCPLLSLLIHLQSILDNMLCPPYKCYTNGTIFFKLNLNVHPNWAMCRTYLTLTRLRVKATLKVNNCLRKCSEILTCTWIFLKLEQIFIWNFKYMLSVTSKTCRWSFITKKGRG